MTPAQRAHLHRTIEFVGKAIRDGDSALDIISWLQANHGATYGLRGGAYFLRVAGVTSTCTWSRDRGLLDGWRRNATLRLAKELKFGGCN